jgi:hypothetical protein
MIEVDGHGQGIHHCASPALPDIRWQGMSRITHDRRTAQ